MKTTISLKLFSLLTMTLLISTTVFSSEIGTANAQKYSVIATIPVGDGPSGIAINPTNGWVYVANGHSNKISVINPATNTVVATIPVGDARDVLSLSGIAIATNGLAYVTSPDSSGVSVIDLATNTLVATIAAVGDGPSGVVASTINGWVYVANADSDTVSVIARVS